MLEGGFSAKQAEETCRNLAAIFINDSLVSREVTEKFLDSNRLAILTWAKDRLK